MKYTRVEVVEAIREAPDVDAAVKILRAYNVLRDRQVFARRRAKSFVISQKKRKAALRAFFAPYRRGA